MDRTPANPSEVNCDYVCELDHATEEEDATTWGNRRRTPTGKSPVPQKQTQQLEKLQYVNHGATHPSGSDVGLPHRWSNYNTGDTRP